MPSQRALRWLQSDRGLDHSGQSSRWTVRSPTAHDRRAQSDTEYTLCASATKCSTPPLRQAMLGSLFLLDDHCCSYASRYSIHRLLSPRPERHVCHSLTYDEAASRSMEARRGLLGELARRRDGQEKRRCDMVLRLFERLPLFRTRSRCRQGDPGYPLYGWALPYLALRLPEGIYGTARMQEGVHRRFGHRTASASRQWLCFGLSLFSSTS